MDALTAKLGRMSKQIILTAAGAGIAMAIAHGWRPTLDSVLPKKKVEEEETPDEPKAHRRRPGRQGAERVLRRENRGSRGRDVAQKPGGDAGRVVGLVAGRGSEAGRAR